MQIPPRRVLIVGCKGLLGTPTTAIFSAEAAIQTIGLDLPEIDITDSANVRRNLDAFRPDLVVNCAAYTRVDDCETNEAVAMRVNGDGPGILAREAARIDARLFHISTDYVFAGAADRPYPVDHPTGDPARLSAYGRTKLAGEQAVQSNHPAPLIIRTAWLYGPDGPGFPPTILRLAREKPRLQVVNDQRGSPTYAPDLAGALRRLADVRLAGIVHVTNSGNCTWYDLACEILRLAGIQTPVEPVTSEQFPRPAKRPAYSVLDLARYENAVGEKMRPWQDALREYIHRGRF